MGLDIVELVMSFEEEFEIEIPDEAAAEMETLGHVVDYVAAEYARLGRPFDLLDLFLRVRGRTLVYAPVDPDTITRSTRFVDDLNLD